MLNAYNAMLQDGRAAYRWGDTEDGYSAVLTVRDLGGGWWCLTETGYGFVVMQGGPDERVSDLWRVLRDENMPTTYSPDWLGEEHDHIKILF